MARLSGVLPSARRITQPVFVKMLYSFIAVLPGFLALWYRGDKFFDRRFSSRNLQNDAMEFDFIVVGSGPSGAVVANRLSENPNWRILLLEAGGEPNPLHSIPGFSFFMVNWKETDWQHFTIPLVNSSLALREQRTLLSQGKALGGTSNINWLVHLRGNPKDFDHWGDITGDSSWRYDNLLPYFRKSENYKGEWRNSEVHGKDGPMSIEVPDYNSLGDDIIEAGKEMGYDKVDLNGYYTEGFEKIHMPLNRGFRGSVNFAFIRPMRRRTNVVIRKYAHVKKVLINEMTKEAYGVEYDKHGTTYRAIASKEVILSAGAMQSPKILMLSGIGIKSDLEKLGIKSLADLPVGKNLQDHVATIVPFTLDVPKSLIIDRDLSLNSMRQLLFQGKGPLTSSGCEAAGIISSDWAKERGQSQWPDLLFLFLGVGFHKTYIPDVTRPFNVIDETLDNRVIGNDGLGAMVSVARPTSRGYLRLASADPYDPLVIDPRYYETPEDVNRTIDGIQKAIQLIGETEAFKKLGVRLEESVVKPCRGYGGRTVEYWDCHLRHLTLSLHHVVGTAAMGRRGDANAVVDSELRVIGIQNLRVIDASIMPVVPVSNTQAPCLMIGEKGADLIKSKWST